MSEQCRYACLETWRKIPISLGGESSWSCDLNLDVSKNNGTPKWMIKNMENPIKMDDLGVPLFLETPNLEMGFSKCEVSSKDRMFQMIPLCFFILMISSDRGSLRKFYQPLVPR